MKRRNITTVLAACAAAAMVTACKKGGPAGAGMQRGAPAVTVHTVKEERVFPTTELAGRVAASLTAEVRPQVGGILRKRLFTEGADVKEGEVLYEIDPAPYQAVHDGAKAALAKAEANLEPLRLRAERYEELLESDAVSRQDYDDAAAAHRLALAEIEGAKAALEAARINLEYTKVAAPISGRIGRSAVTDGALVTASQPLPMATIQRLDPVFVDVTRSSAEMLRLQRELSSGMISRENGETKVELRLDDGSDYPETGSLKFSEAFVDPGTGSVTLRTVFPNPGLTLLPGMFVRAILTEGVVENGILIPQRAVTRDATGTAVVMLAGENDIAEPRPVQVERSVGDNWLISSGLRPGERVIMEGLQRVRPGMPLKVSEFGAPPPDGDASESQPMAAEGPDASPASESDPAAPTS